MFARYFLMAAALGVAAPAVAHGPGNAHAGAAHGATMTDGQPGNAADVKRTVRVTVRDDDYDVKSIQVRAGETIRFIIKNDGYEPHEFNIANPQEQHEHRAMMRQMPNMRHDDPNAVTIDAGQTRELIWTFGKDADLEFACNIPGHAERGMTGKFRVMR